MARTASGALLPGLSVDTGGRHSMTAQLFNALRQQIKIGGLIREFACRQRARLRLI